MKKIVGLLILCALAFNVQAQSNLISSNTHALIPTLDTVTNTGVKTMTSTRIGGWQHEVVISTVSANLTGTMAGVARLYGSLDGVNYQRIRSTTLYGGQIDSVVLNVNSLKYAWRLTDNPFQFYQVQTTGIGTVTFTVAGKIVAH